MRSPNGELLTQSAARELLQRAGQIDADSTSIETLRDAAREAGISEAAFEAALLEMRSRQASSPPMPSRRGKKPVVLAIGASVFVLAAMVFASRRVAVAPTDRLSGLSERDIPVQCLSMQQAQDIARAALTGTDAFSTSLRSGSRILRVRATTGDLDRVEAALKAAAKAQKSCDNNPASP